ncbi:MAG: NAD-glutamate dehydrogenase domain-containing protein [Pseudomonadota bacterium]
MRRLSLGNSGSLLLVNSPNAAFIVDSILALQRRLDISIQVLAHPMLAIKRKGDEILHLGDVAQSGPKESFIVIRLEACDATSFERMETEIRRLLGAALSVHRDRAAMTDELRRLQAVAGLAPWSDFVEWLGEAAFFPFSYHNAVLGDCPLGRAAGTGTLEQSQSLGVSFEHCFGSDFEAFEPADMDALLDELRDYLGRQSGVVVQKTSLYSPLLRLEPLTLIGICEDVGDGHWRQHAFFGLFSKGEIQGPACKVPALCRKIKRVLDELALPPDCHDYLKLKELFDLFPKVELFITGETQLQIIARSLIYYLHRSDTLKFLILASPCPTRVAALVIIPYQLFREELEATLAAFLCEHLPVAVEETQIIHTAGSYVGLNLTLHTLADEIAIDINRLEVALTKLAKPWELNLRMLLERVHGRERGAMLWRRYLKGFSPEYRTLMPPSYALRDVVGMEQVLASGGQTIDLLKPRHGISHYRLHIYSMRESYLDEYMPVLENLNLRVIDQVQFTVAQDGKRLVIKSFSVEPAVPMYRSLTSLRERLLDMLTAILKGGVDNDELNGLMLLTGLSWKEIDVLRTYRNYYFQLGSPFTLPSWHRALLHNPQVAHLLYKYFEARFRPDPDWDDISARDEAALFPLRMELISAMETVTDINEDRILRTLFNLIDATIRSNFHVRRDLDDYFIALKINSLGVIDMPVPRPKFEVYVHSSHMEGIHLRGGEVARGGIRWSERPDDFRTEILDLMRTQMSKNALIVPKGAKGGFVLKKTPSNRDDAQRDAKQAYMTLMRGLLDLTDNRVGNSVVRLPGIIAYDGDDSYLVVAADKGTAQFPDIANAAAAEYRFWLQDAFASGGSQGYNHKELGITARGAWECVKRHFRELGHDIQRQPFTVIGIGSMDGDVFGNGMLLSRQTRLLAAFSGQHIFLDPDPDPEISFAERKRLFDLPGSSWGDYNSDLLSPGGGVFKRGAKDIRLSPEVRKWLGVRYRTLDGESLIRRILMASADLLWLGGIGTYIKASTEKNEEVGDRANDNVRVDATEIRATVVGEGANLGFTQKARIEFSLAGGHINTDAVDNSAGVDTSDHEVNLKILMINLQSKKLVNDYHEPFNRVSEEVCRSVLENNYGQSLCISLDCERSHDGLEPFLELADHLENVGLLDRQSEFFPRRKEFSARYGQNLTRPELAILMAYGKMYLFEALLEDAEFLSESYCRKFLSDYFPEEIRQHYGSHLDGHPLAKEIKATVIANKIINQAGCAFLTWGMNEGDSDIVDWVGTYLTFDRVLAGEELRRHLFSLDNVVPSARQYALLLDLEKTLSRFCHWAMGHGKRIQPNIDTLERYTEFLAQYECYLEGVETGGGNEAFLAELTRYREDGFTETQARRMALLPRLEDFPRLVELTLESKGEFAEVVQLNDVVTAYLGLKHILAILAEIPARDYWERSVKMGLVERIKSAVSKLTVQVSRTSARDVSEFVGESLPSRVLRRYQRIHQQISEMPPANLLPFAALCGELDALAEICGRRQNDVK